MIRPAIAQLKQMGKLPSEDETLRAFREEGLEITAPYERLLMSIERPVTDEEARVLLTLFGDDNAFGLAWTVFHLIRSALGWPFEDLPATSDNEWVRLLIGEPDPEEPD